MTNKIKLEVDQWVELNNGERLEVRKVIGSAYYIGPYVYQQNGLLIMAGQSHPLSVARILPHMTLPSGDVLFEGDFAKRRDGEVVGPLEYRNDPFEYFAADGWHYNSSGRRGYEGRGDGCPDHDLIARADPPEAETQDEPKLLRDMTAEEVVALVEADKAGKAIQCFGVVNWHDCREFVMDLDCAYRIKPAEPVRETVALYGADVGYGWEFDEVSGDNLTRITLPLIDGKIPTGTFTNEDGETIVVEELE